MVALRADDVDDVVVRPPSRSPRSPCGELVGVEGTGEQLAKRDGRATLAGVEEEVGAAVLEQHLAAAPARRERLAVARRSR